MNQYERLSDIAVEIDGMKESFEDACLLEMVIAALHSVAKKHNPANYENLDHGQLQDSGEA